MTGLVADITGRATATPAWAYTYATNQASPTTSVVYQRDASGEIVGRTSTVTGLSTVGFRAASSANTGSGTATSVTVTKPAGVVAGDVMIAAVTLGSTTPTITAPTGWTLVRTQVNGTAIRTSVYSKVAGAAEPVSYVFSFSAASRAAAAVSAYTGVDTTAPVAVNTGGTNASATAQVAPTATTTSTNQQVIRVWGAKASVTFTPPAGITERADVRATGTGSVGLAVGDASQPVGVRRGRRRQHRRRRVLGRM